MQEQDQIIPASAYQPPHLEILGQLTDLAVGQGENGLLIVMQTG